MRTSTFEAPYNVVSLRKIIVAALRLSGIHLLHGIHLYPSVSIGIHRWPSVSVDIRRDPTVVAVSSGVQRYPTASAVSTVSTVTTVSIGARFSRYPSESNRTPFNVSNGINGIQRVHRYQQHQRSPVSDSIQRFSTVSNVQPRSNGIQRNSTLTSYNGMQRYQTVFNGINWTIGMHVIQYPPYSTVSNVSDGIQQCSTVSTVSRVSNGIYVSTASKRRATVPASGTDGAGVRSQGRNHLGSQSVLDNRHP